jgi:hypothetical protein
VGAHIALQSIGTGQEALATFGFRLQIAIEWVFGSKGQHALTVAPLSVNIYLPAAGGTATIDPHDYGLDQRGATWGVTFGYTHRFRQAFGSSPIITLE